MFYSLFFVATIVSASEYRMMKYDDIGGLGVDYWGEKAGPTGGYNDLAAAEMACDLDKECSYIWKTGRSLSLRSGVYHDYKWYTIAMKKGVKGCPMWSKDYANSIVYFREGHITDSEKRSRTFDANGNCAINSPNAILTAFPTMAPSGPPTEYQTNPTAMPTMAPTGPPSVLNQDVDSEFESIGKGFCQRKYGGTDNGSTYVPAWFVYGARTEELCMKVANMYEGFLAYSFARGICIIYSQENDVGKRWVWKFVCEYYGTEDPFRYDCGDDIIFDTPAPEWNQGETLQTFEWGSVNGVEATEFECMKSTKMDRPSLEEFDRYWKSMYGGARFDDRFPSDDGDNDNSDANGDGDADSDGSDDEKGDICMDLMKEVNEPVKQLRKYCGRLKVEGCKWDKKLETCYKRIKRDSPRECDQFKTTKQCLRRTNRCKVVNYEGKSICVDI